MAPAVNAEKSIHLSLYSRSTAFELSYSKGRALSRVANASNEASLLAFAMTTTAARLEERCRQLANVMPGAVEAANGAHASRSLRAWHDAQRQRLVVTVELPLEQGEVVLSALDRAVEAGRCEQGPEFGAVSWSAQRADARVAVACVATPLTRPSRTPRRPSSRS